MTGQRQKQKNKVAVTIDPQVWKEWVSEELECESDLISDAVEDAAIVMLQYGVPRHAAFLSLRASAFQLALLLSRCILQRKHGLPTTSEAKKALSSLITFYAERYTEGAMVAAQHAWGIRWKDEVKQQKSNVIQFRNPAA